jgi:hypothetical protein
MGDTSSPPRLNIRLSLVFVLNWKNEAGKLRVCLFMEMES